MGLQFILGRAGTGKTYRCLESLRSAALAEPDGPPLVLLVPEQATFQMEQALLSQQGGLKGMVRAQVLSFQRLAWRVSLQSGGLAAPPLSDLGKQMVLRALLQGRKGELKLFGHVADRPGFMQRLAGTISEMRSYKQTPADLRSQLSAMTAQSDAGSASEGVLGLKLHDLALVMSDLRAYIAGRFTDPDDYLPVLADHLEGSGLLTDAAVWVDSFSGFTPQELDVLRAIIQSAARVHLTLALDPVRAGMGKPGPTDLFHPSLVTFEQVSKLAADHSIPVEKPVILPSAPPIRFRNTPELAHLEQHLFTLVPPPPYAGEGGVVALVKAPSRRLEVEEAAREILRLVREAGFRYREISVVARNLDAYGDLAGSIFTEYGIPAFVDRKRAVAHHPLVELIRSSLEVVTANWGYDPVFRFLKTDLAVVQRHEVDELENYVLEHGIRGDRWHDGNPWTFLRQYTLEEDPDVSPRNAAALDRINLIRSRATAELAAFQRRVGGGRSQRQTVRTISTALFQLLEQLGVAKRLGGWSTDSEAAGDLEAAREHEQVWTGVMEILDQIVEAMGDTQLTLSEYSQVLFAGLDSLRLGLIPPGLDYVAVGTVERSRHSGVRATLILGATDKDFPPLPAEDVIFTDSERERLERGGFEMGPSSLLKLFEEQYFTYLALTRGSERLWISYPVSDDSGRAVAPAPVLRRLMQALPAVRPTMVGQSIAGDSVSGDSVSSDSVSGDSVNGDSVNGDSLIQAILTPVHLGAAMVKALRLHRTGYKLDPVWLDLYQWVAKEPALRERLAPIISALKYEETFGRQLKPLGSELAVQLYGEPMTTSVSRMEAFSACPFQHFAGYGLRLKERARFQVSAPELGMFYHAALSLFVRQLLSEGRTWESLSPEEAIQRMDPLVDQLARRLSGEILLSSPQHGYILRSVRRTLRSSLGFLGEHIWQGQFRPLWVELPFGEAADGIPGIEVPVLGSAPVRLRGRIDRVDGMQSPDGTWFLRVMDYKSRPRTLDLGRVYHGLGLQLLLYLHAVMRHAGSLLKQPARPAGALYYPVHDPLERLANPAEATALQKLRRNQYRAKGLLIDDPAIVRAMDVTGLGLTQASINKDGSIRRGAPVASEAQFQLLFEHIGAVVASSAHRLLQGEVGVSPYKLNGQVPCGTCQFSSVCQFEPLVAGQEYRTLPALKGQAVWERLAGGGDLNES